MVSEKHNFSQLFHFKIKDIKQDVIETIDKCSEVTDKEATPNLIKGMFQAILRLFAPLM